MRDPGTTYYYVIDNTGGTEYADLASAQDAFQAPNTTPERIIVEARVVKKKVQVLSEVVTQ